MKILSNFDSTYASSLYKENVALFGEEHVSLVRKSRLIRYATVFSPVAMLFAFLILGIYVIYMYVSDLPVIIRLFRCIMALWIFFLGKKLVGKYIDYTMDFLIVTPKEVMKFDQKGIFNRIAEKIAADKIKTITVKKEWFWASFFNVGSIIFLAEGQSETGDIIMDYVDAVESVEKTIKHVLGQDTLGVKN